MRVICPHCQKTVSLADSVAEQPTPCPACGHVFTAPSLMAPEPPPPVAAPAPVQVTPPNPSASGPAISIPPEHTPPPMSPPTMTASPGGTVGGMRFELSKRALHWVGPVALFVLFVCTFFTWVGAYSESTPVYTQSAWSAITGGFWADAAGDGVFDRETVLRKWRTFGTSMFLALVVILLPSLAISLLDFAQDYVQFAVPDAVQAIWPRRLAFLTVAAALIFALLSFQLLSGFGLETAARSAADEMTAAPTADPAKPEEGTASKMVRDLKRGLEINRYGLRRGTALWLGYFASLAALVGYGLETWMDRRGKKKPPAIEVTW